MFRLLDLIERFGTAPSQSERLVLGALVEQAVADRAVLLAADSARERVTRSLREVRAGLAAIAEVLVHRTPGTETDPAAIANAMRVAAGEVIDPAALTGPPPTLRRKYWPLVPECLSIHFASVDEIVEEMRSLPVLTAVEAPTVVVGVRSSGSVLAPILVACLATPTRYLTVRPSDVPPGTPCAAVERELRQAGIGPGDAVVVVDDPPTSGRTRRIVQESVVTVGAEHAGFIGVGQRDAALRRYAKLVATGAADPEYPSRRRPRPASPFGPYAVRDGEDFLVAVGDPGPARAAVDALRRVAPSLRPRVENGRVRMKWSDDAGDHGEMEDRERKRHAAALGRWAGRVAAEYAVDPLPASVWRELTGRRLAKSEESGPRLDGGADHLLALPFGREWWNFRFEGSESCLVPGLVGHWAHVVDTGELVAGLAVEFLLENDDFARLCAGFRESGFPEPDRACLATGFRLVALDIRRELDRMDRSAVAPEWTADRLRRFAVADRGQPGPSTDYSNRGSR